jgi:CRISPR/Cas system-associated endonuclease/helicase Cas3
VSVLVVWRTEGPSPAGVGRADQAAAIWKAHTAPSMSAQSSRSQPRCPTAVWTEDGVQAVEADVDSDKVVRIESSPGWTGDNAARHALAAERQAARVLVVRDTGTRAQETYEACSAVAPALQLQVNGVATLHHGRFAAEDRALLDGAVETAIGKDSPLGGRIVVGKQTLEHSLDLCAGLLISDLCPMDELLQRIGRLHRHRRPRGNLAGDTDLAGAVLHMLLNHLAEVSPGAKLGSTAPCSRASFLLVEAGDRQPRSLAEAFRTPCAANAGAAVGLPRTRGDERSSRITAARG